MANPYINKVVLGNETLLDLTADTITAADLAQGVTAHDASGAAIVGTMTGGGTEAGTVTQDENGFLVLDDDAPSGRVTVEALSVTQNGTYTAPSGKAYSPVTVNVSGGGGLEYETGTWTPSSNTISQFITFAGTHTVAPFYFEISDVTGSYSPISSTNFFLQYTNYHQLSGTSINVDNAGVLEYGQVSGRFRLSSATALNNMVISITTPYTSSDDSTTACSRYWATETGINASSNGTRYWRSTRTYKWIAVWAPTS